MMITKNNTEPAGVKTQKPLRNENHTSRTSRKISGSLPASCSGTYPDRITCLCFPTTNYNTLTGNRQAAFR